MRQATYIVVATIAALAVALGAVLYALHSFVTSFPDIAFGAAVVLIAGYFIWGGLGLVLSFLR